MENINKNNLILAGIGASPGIAQGKVKIITKDSDYKNFNQGDILVAKITDPSMVVLMRKAAAIITDIGGLTSHPAIVSREMGVPCVVATKEATTRLKDGQKIKVDGTAGQIFLLEPIKDKIKNQDYEDLIESYRQAFLTMDLNTFDVSTDYTKLDPLMASSWMKKILEIINELEKQKLSNEEIAKLLHSPSVIRDVAIFDLFMASLAKIPAKERLKIADFYIKALKAICRKDPFALNKKNIIHSPQEIKEFIKNTRPGTPNIAKKLGSLISACYHLSYSLYGDMNPQILYENYGPYYIRDRSNQKYLVVIKEFKNMKPVEIWPEIEKLPFSKIRIVAIYKDVEFTIDSITHTNYQGDIINNLKCFSLEIDNKTIDIEKINSAMDIIENFSQLIWSKFKKLDFERFKVLYLYQKAYNYYYLCKKLGLEWRPDQEIINEVADKPLKEWLKFKNPREADNFFLKIIDPRTDFSG